MKLISYQDSKFLTALVSSGFKAYRNSNSFSFWGVQVIEAYHSPVWNFLFEMAAVRLSSASSSINAIWRASRTPS